MNGATNDGAKDTQVIALAGKDVEVQAGLLWVTRHAASFEIRDAGVSPRVSEKFESLRIIFRGRTIYLGPAVVRGLVSTGLTLNCEVSLGEGGWSDVARGAGAVGWDSPSTAFKSFLRGWQDVYQVAPEYKVVVADIHAFLTDLNLWLQQAEIEIGRFDEDERARHEEDFARELRESALPAIEHLFNRFEQVSNTIPADLVPAHRAFCKRQLHPLVLCAPFIHRTFTKPLGYAGDYEMMNMIVRNGLEGASLFAKVVNAYMLDQAPAHGVRSRVDLLRDRMIDETMRVSRFGRSARVFSVACGPAREVQDFLATHPLADRAEFCLLDFNQETLNYTGSRLDEIKRRHRRRTGVELVRDSVQSLLRRGARAASQEPAFDFVYCSGLYDYLSDNVCKALNTCLYERLAPGGLMLIGNFAPHNPIRNIMEHLLEWFLIYRDSMQLAGLGPSQVSQADCNILAENSGTNIFLEVRKPE